MNIQLLFLGVIKICNTLVYQFNNLKNPIKMKKLQLLSVAAMLLFSINMNAKNVDETKTDDVIVNSSLNLLNPDVRKCLLESSKTEGWDLKSVYLNSEDKVVMIFNKADNKKIYMSK